MTKKRKLQIRNSTAEFLIFTNQAKEDGIEVRVQDETIWLSQKLMAALFDCSTDNISLHLKNIFKDNELDEDAVTEEFSVTASDGKTYKTKHYNLDAIIAVGYRINSKRATAFRQWATSVLRDYAIRGYVIDRKRMENGTFLGEDYFEHLLAEIREIRLSERRFYQKITDIYATAMDYNKDAVTTKDFFAKVQNKLHYAVHGNTAAELIMTRANAEKEHMGLTSWEKSPDGKIIKTDVPIAKNYLTETELESLGRIVNAYLDLAEDRAKKHIPMTMEDWAKRLDKFLEADDREVLQSSGKVTALMAKDFAESEFEKYRIVQDRLFESDFDKKINVSSAIKCFGLAGMPVSQSKSPALFHAAYHGKYAYALLPTATAEEAMHLFRERGLAGMNITMPLKELMLPFITMLDDAVALLHAVNTVVWQQGILRGYNTDVQGVAGALTEAGVALLGRRCVVLGAGGAGRAAACALAQAGATLTIANRSADRAEAAATLFHATPCTLTEALQHSDEYDVIVNTLPAAANIAAHLCPESWQAVLDADYVHKPLQTVCRNAGATYIDGSRWLLHQAIPAYRLFTGEEPDVAAMMQALQQERIT